MTFDSLARAGKALTRQGHFEHVLGTSLDVRWVADRRPGSAIRSRLRAIRGSGPGAVGRGYTSSLVPWRRLPMAAVERAVLSEIERLERVFSTYRQDSELSRLLDVGDAPVELSGELADLLETADLWRARTGGAFDPACGALRPLTLDGIAKGTIIDRACEAGARANGGRDIVVDIGGDMRHIGSNTVVVGIVDPDRDAENAPPLERVAIRDQGLATSGGFRRGAWIDGSWHSHLVDPRTGRAVDHVRLASVVAPAAETADALATAFCVLEPEESLALADSLPGVGCLLVLADGRRLSNEVWGRGRVEKESRSIASRAAGSRSIGRRQMLARLFGGGLFLGTRRRAAGQTAGVATARSVPWDESMELVITFEFGDPRGGMASRRPFVVVYVDDADANAVRTVGLWALKAPWIRELSRWMRGERARKAARGGDLILTAAPTRAPGRYSVIWDGKDDQGAWVDQGEYFVNMETIRQGSSSYFTRHPFTFESTPFQAEMEDYGGFSNIQLDFRKRA